MPPQQELQVKLGPHGAHPPQLEPQSAPQCWRQSMPQPGLQIKPWPNGPHGPVQQQPLKEISATTIAGKAHLNMAVASVRSTAGPPQPLAPSGNTAAPQSPLRGVRKKYRPAESSESRKSLQSANLAGGPG